MEWETLVEDIRSDKTAGAAELAARAVAAVFQWLERPEHTSLTTWKVELLAFGCALWQAQPAMAPLFNLANHMVLAAESTSTFVNARHRVHQAAQTFLQQLERSQAELMATTLLLISPAARILTFSYSSTVLAVLLAARARHIPLTVFCTESRPMREGQRLAAQLAHAGIPVQFGVDAAVSRFAAEASLVLMGADSVTRAGIINKVGTTAVALAARALSVPCYVICDRQKWLPAAAVSPGLDHLQPAEEVWPDPPRGVKVWNAYFEYTPLDLLTGVIAEEGVLSPDEVMQRLTAMPVAAGLALTPAVSQRERP